MLDSKSLETFLEQAGRGCISGTINEWPQLKPACEYAIQEITFLRKELELMRRWRDKKIREHSQKPTQ